MCLKTSKRKGSSWKEEINIAKTRFKTFYPGEKWLKKKKHKKKNLNEKDNSLWRNAT